MTTRVLVTGMGGELGTRVAQLIEARRMGDRDRRRRLRSASPAAAPRPVPAYRPARRRPARGVRRGVCAARRRALRRLRTRVPDDTGVRARTHRLVHGRDACRGFVHGRPRVRRAAQRARGLRTAERVGLGSRRRRRARPDHGVRALVALGGGRGQRCCAALRCSGRRAAVRAGSRIACAEPVGPAAPPPGRPGECALRSAVLRAAP